MELFIIGIASLVVSLLTFFTGFGLGAILMPVFAIFFPVDVAVALTGVVHLLNNAFKLFLVGNKASAGVVLRFGIPAVIGAFIGAALLLRMATLKPLYSYILGDKQFFITPVKLIIALLLIFFALMEAIPRFKNMQFGKDKMVIGGLLSGFFGGLSGHQGALRSAFLLKAGLSKESFIATGVIVACLVDLSRLAVYFKRYISTGLHQNGWLLAIASVCAFAGAICGSLLLKKITLTLVQSIVTIMLIIISIALGAGLI